MGRNVIVPETQRFSNEEMVGKTFCWLTVLEILNETRGKHLLCLCRCKCGKEVKKAVSHVRIGKLKSCGCSLTNTNFVSEHIIQAFWYGIQDNKHRKSRTLDFTITPEYLDLLWSNQNGRCFFTDLELILPLTSKQYLERDFTASVDRIDSNLGYVFDNVCWAHKEINAMKMAMTNEDFIRICNEVYNVQN